MLRHNVLKHSDAGTHPISNDVCLVLLIHQARERNEREDSEHQQCHTPRSDEADDERGDQGRKVLQRVKTGC